jgi:hypothetical protein
MTLQIFILVQSMPTKASPSHYPSRSWPRDPACPARRTTPLSQGTPAGAATTAGWVSQVCCIST